ncbi:MAG: response regulator [Lachnospiraceae bacterium]|nr:response regulator [Lachnospiraceae bacterium]
MKSLYFKMTIMIVLVVLISVGLLLMISYRRARDTMASQLEDSYSVQADKYAQELTAWLNSQATIVETMAVEITLNGMYEQDYETFHKYLADSFSRLNTGGYMYDIYFTYPDNSMACASDFMPDGSMDYAHERDWFKVAAETGELFYSTPYKDSDSGYSIITISKAVYKDDELQGILAVDVFVNTLIDIVRGADVATNGYAFLVDQNMGMIVHPYEAYSYDDTPPNIMSIPDSPYAEVVDNIITDSRETVFIKDYDGVTRGIVIARMNNTGWHVGIATDRNELLRNVSGLLRSFIIAAFTAIIIGICISAFMAQILNKLNRQLREQDSIQRAKITNMNVTRSLATTIDAKDRYTSGHSQRVAEYAVELARRMGKSEEEQQIVYYAGVLHDIGKIRVPEDVINKPGKLTEEEFDQIRIHPVSGYHILCGIHEDERVGYGAKYHHERYDGKGYPNGLSGKDIPEIARIIAVADSYDAMASDRSYRKALPQDVIRKEIEKGKGTQFDPEIADVMLSIIDEDKTYDLQQKEKEIDNILVVDDEKMTLMVVEHILKGMEKVRVYSARSKEEVFSVLKETKISLIMLDLKMPDIDGFELYSGIREIYDMPVVLMTGDKSAKTLQKIRELGIDDYITKPLNGAITKEVVYGVLHKGVIGSVPVS